MSFDMPPEIPIDREEYEQWEKERQPDARPAQQPLDAVQTQIAADRFFDYEPPASPAQGEDGELSKWLNNYAAECDREERTSDFAIKQFRLAADTLDQLRKAHDETSDRLNEIRTLLDEPARYASRLNLLDQIRAMVCQPLPETEQDRLIEELYRDINQLQAELASKEAENVKLREAFNLYASGDVLVRWNPDGFWSFHGPTGRRLAGPCDTAIESVLQGIPRIEEEIANDAALTR